MPVYKLSAAGGFAQGRTSYKSMAVGNASAAVPIAPTIGTATAGAAQATVEFTASAIGATATSFTATSSPGGITGSASSSPITVTGLTAGTPYTFTVYATNANGNSSSSAASGEITPTTPPGTGSYDALASYTVPSGGISSVTISGLPQSGYQHLQIRAFLLPNSGGGNTNYIQLNGDTGGNYSWQMLRNASGAGLYGTSDVEMILPSSYGSPSSIIIDILDYTNTSKYKTIKAIGGGENGSNGYINLSSGSWRNLSSINSFKLYSNSGSYLQYSNIAVYGIRG